MASNTTGAQNPAPAKPKRKKRMLWRDIFRTLRKSKGRFISIAALIALGSFALVGFQITGSNMRSTLANYTTAYGFTDLTVIGDLGLDEDDMADIESVEGIRAVEYGYLVDVEIEGTDDSVRIQNVPEELSCYELVEGELPTSDEEIAIGQDMADDYNLSIGDTVTFYEEEDELTGYVLTNHTYTVVGIVNSTEILSYLSKGSTTVGTGDLTYYAVTDASAFDVDYYMCARVSFEDTEDLDPTSDEYLELVAVHKAELQEALSDAGERRYATVAAEYQDAIDEGEEELAEGEQELADAEQELTDAETELSDAEQELADAETELSDAETELSDAAVELDDAEAELSDAAAQLASAKAELASGAAEISDAEEEIASAESQIAAAEAEIAEGEDELASNEETLEAAAATLAASKAELDAAASEIEAAEEELAANEEALEAAQEQVDAYYAALAEYEAGCEQVEALQAQLAALEAAAEADTETDYSTQIATLTATIEAAETELAAAKEQLDAQSATVAAAEEEIAAGTTALAEAEEELAAAKAAYEEGLAAYEAGFAEYEAGVAAYEEGAATIAAAKEALAESKTQLAEAKKQLAAAQADYEEGLSSYNDGVSEYEEGLAEYNDGVAEYEEGLAEYEEALAEYNDGVAEYEDGLAEYEEALAEYNEEAPDAYAEIDEGYEDLELVYEALAELTVPDYTVQTHRETYGSDGYTVYIDVSEIVDSLARIFPYFMYLVAALVASTTMTRMVDEERVNSGTLKALGYDDMDVLKKFTAYGAAAGLIGAIIGIILGHTALPLIVYMAMADGFSLPQIELSFHPVVTLVTLLLSLLVSVGPAIVAAKFEVTAKPAELLTPKAPASGSKIFLERITPIWNRLSFTHKVTCRNLFRYKARAAMTIIGVAGAACLMFCGFAVQNSVNGISEKQFGDIIQYDLIVANDEGATEDEVAEVEDLLESDDVTDYAEIYYEELTCVAGDAGDSQTINLLVAIDEEEVMQYLNLYDGTTWAELELPEEGAIISKRLAQLCDLEVGDYLTFTDADGNEESVLVAGICKMYMEHFMFMSADAYESNSGDVAENNAYVAALEDDSVEATRTMAARFMELDGVLGTVQSATLINLVDVIVDSLNQIMVILIVVSIMLACVIVYNLVTINVAERMRELSTIKVLGFYSTETTMYIYRETIVLTIIALPVGWFLGYLLQQYIINAVCPDNVMFSGDVGSLAFIVSTVVIGAVVALMGLVVYRQLKTVDMLEALKSVD